MIFKLNLYILAIINLILQYTLWLGESNIFLLRKLHRDLLLENLEIEKLANNNTNLSHEIINLKKGTDAIEESARINLGYIKPGEVYLYVP